MRKPRIGITVDYVNGKEQYMLGHHYVTAVEKAGGLPLLLPYKTDPALVPHYVDTLDGCVLTGGADLDPALFGDAGHPQSVRIDPDRQRFELAVLAEVERRAMPVLGICLGSQVMNVHRGGTLYQFLPDLNRTGPLEHQRLDLDSRRHEVTIDPRSKLASVLGATRLSANTSHKQAVKTVGRALRIVAHAPDAVVEGVEDPSFPFYIGVQWHPERLHDETEHLRLFQHLVQQASTWAGQNAKT